METTGDGVRFTLNVRGEQLKYVPEFKRNGREGAI